MSQTSFGANTAQEGAGSYAGDIFELWLRSQSWTGEPGLEVVLLVGIQRASRVLNSTSEPFNCKNRYRQLANATAFACDEVIFISSLWTWCCFFSLHHTDVQYRQSRRDASSLRDLKKDTGGKLLILQPEKTGDDVVCTPHTKVSVAALPVGRVGTEKRVDLVSCSSIAPFQRSSALTFHTPLPLISFWNETNLKKK